MLQVYSMTRSMLLKFQHIQPHGKDDHTLTICSTTPSSYLQYMQAIIEDQKCILTVNNIDVRTQHRSAWRKLVADWFAGSPSKVTCSTKWFTTLFSNNFPLALLVRYSRVWQSTHTSSVMVLLRILIYLSPYLISANIAQFYSYVRLAVCH